MLNETSSNVSLRLAAGYLFAVQRFLFFARSCLRELQLETEHLTSTAERDHLPIERVHLERREKINTPRSSVLSNRVRRCLRGYSIL